MNVCQPAGSGLKPSSVPTDRVVLELRWFDVRQPLGADDARHRTTAFIYGDPRLL